MIPNLKKVKLKRTKKKLLITTVFALLPLRIWTEEVSNLLFGTNKLKVGTGTEGGARLSSSQFASSKQVKRTWFAINKHCAPADRRSSRLSSCFTNSLTHTLLWPV